MCVSPSGIAQPPEGKCFVVTSSWGIAPRTTGGVPRPLKSTLSYGFMAALRASGAVQGGETFAARLRPARGPLGSGCPGGRLFSLASPMHRVFAYGSNMCLPDLARFLREHGHVSSLDVSVHPALLVGHRLVWNYFSPPRNGGAANVEVCEGRDLPGVVLEVDAPLLLSLDLKEGHPHRYARALRPVRLVAGESVDAWVYAVTPPYREPHRVPPRRAYLELLVEGARAHGLPEWHLAELLGTPTAD